MYGLLLRLAFRAKFLAGLRKAYRKNPEKYKAAAKQWARANPAKRKEIMRANWARRRSSVSNRSAVLRIYRRCEELRQWFNVVVDHIIPIAKGGAHSPENLQIIYRRENMIKGTRLDYKPSVIFI